MDSSDQFFMRRAIMLASAAAARPGQAPISCVIVIGGEVVGEGCNEVGPRIDPTAHAEIVAIQRAAKAR